MLCGLLESTGIAGRPASYFRRDYRDVSPDSGGVPGTAGPTIDDAFIEAAVAAGSTPNGVFGVRVMGETMPELTVALASGRSGEARPDVELLTATFGRTRFVHLRRRDVVAQAVSWARAEQTHFWHPGEEVIPGGRSPQFDRDLIGELVGRIDSLEAWWRGWFAGQGIAPYELTYEDLAAHPVSAARAVLGFLGLDLPAGRAIVARHRRQADDLNADWITRFRAEARPAPEN